MVLCAADHWSSLWQGQLTFGAVSVTSIYRSTFVRFGGHRSFGPNHRALVLFANVIPNFI